MFADEFLPGCCVSSDTAPYEGSCQRTFFQPALLDSCLSTPGGTQSSAQKFLIFCGLARIVAGRGITRAIMASTKPSTRSQQPHQGQAEDHCARDRTASPQPHCEKLPAGCRPIHESRNGEDETQHAARRSEKGKNGSYQSACASPCLRRLIH